MTTRDHTTLTALIKAYEHSIVFEESLPSPLVIAKMFTQMRWSNGGLVLLGVRCDDFIIGIDPSKLDAVYARFERLCAELTRTRIQLGTLVLHDRVVVFMAFNTIQRNLTPLRHYSGCIQNSRLI